MDSKQHTSNWRPPALPICQQHASHTVYTHTHTFPQTNELLAHTSSSTAHAHSRLAHIIFFFFVTCNLASAQGISFGQLQPYFADGTVVGLLNNTTQVIQCPPPPGTPVLEDDYIMIMRSALGFARHGYMPAAEPKHIDLGMNTMICGCCVLLCGCCGCCWKRKQNKQKQYQSGLQLQVARVQDAKKHCADHWNILAQVTGTHWTMGSGPMSTAGCDGWRLVAFACPCCCCGVVVPCNEILIRMTIQPIIMIMLLTWVLSLCHYNTTSETMTMVMMMIMMMIMMVMMMIMIMMVIIMMIMMTTVKTRRRHHPSIHPSTQLVSVARTVGSTSVQSSDPAGAEDGSIAAAGETSSSTVSGLPPGLFMGSAEDREGAFEEDGLYQLPKEYLSSVDEQQVRGGGIWNVKGRVMDNAKGRVI